MVAKLFGEGFDETDHAGFGDPIGGEVNAGFGCASTGKGDDFGATRSAGEQVVEGAKWKKSAVEIYAYGVAPTCWICTNGGTDFTLDTGAADEAVYVRPSGGHGLSGALDLSPISDVTARSEESARVLGRKIGLLRAGQTPDQMTSGEELGGERTTDACAGSGDDEVHVWRRGSVS